MLSLPPRPCPATTETLSGALALLSAQDSATLSLSVAATTAKKKSSRVALASLVVLTSSYGRVSLFCSLFFHSLVVELGFSWSNWVFPWSRLVFSWSRSVPDNPSPARRRLLGSIRGKGADLGIVSRWPIAASLLLLERA